MSELESNIKIDPKDIGIEYEYLSSQEIEELEKHLNFVLENPKPKPSQSQWNDAWQEILDNGNESPNYLNTARYNIDGAGVFRWNKSYIKSKDNLLEKKYHQAIIENIAKNYLKEFEYIAEFGCGTGHNLSLIKEIFPDKKFYGADFAKSSQEFLEKIGLKGFYFNMKSCKDPIPKELKENHKKLAVLTVGSLEQLGTECIEFINFLKELNAGLVINIEPISELYEKNHTYDQYALKYHQNRNYLDGYFTELNNQSLLSDFCRTTFGNTYNEGFTVLKWK